MVDQMEELFTLCRDLKNALFSSRPSETEMKPVILFVWYAQFGTTSSVTWLGRVNQPDAFWSICSWSPNKIL